MTYFIKQSPLRRTYGITLLAFVADSANSMESVAVDLAMARVEDTIEQAVIRAIMLSVISFRHIKIFAERLLELFLHKFALLMRHGDSAVHSSAHSFFHLVEVKVCLSDRHCFLVLFLFFFLILCFLFLFLR